MRTLVLYAPASPRWDTWNKISKRSSSTLLVQSLNCPFFPSPIGAEPGRVKRQFRIIYIGMLRTPPFFPPHGGYNHVWMHFPDSACGAIFWIIMYKQQFLQSDWLNQRNTPTYANELLLRVKDSFPKLFRSACGNNCKHTFLRSFSSMFSFISRSGNWQILRKEGKNK